MTRVLLKDQPGGAQLIQSLIGAIETLALLFAGTDDSKASAHLQSYISRIEPELIEAVGAGNAAKMLEAFRSAVMTEKHKIESSGASRA